MLACNVEMCNRGCRNTNDVRATSHTAFAFVVIETCILNFNQQNFFSENELASVLELRS